MSTRVHLPHPVQDQLKQRLPRLLRNAESGFDVTYTGIWYTFILFFVLVFVWEFGHIVYTTSSAFNAARAAAQVAAQKVDRDAFVNNQLVVLNEAEAEDQAARTFEDLYGDAPVNFSVQGMPSSSDMRFVQVNVEIQIDFLLVNQLIGDVGNVIMPPMFFNVTAYAEPAFGIGEERQ